jgi:hypothetical protein
MHSEILQLSFDEKNYLRKYHSQTLSKMNVLMIRIYFKNWIDTFIFLRIDQSDLLKIKNELIEKFFY